jgi:asparagine synthase (glutamine-hydrolysing)
MCGISGFVGAGKYDDLKKMNDVLNHRGPDEEGYWVDALKSVYLAHKRLSIIDLESGSQPMVSDDRNLVIIFNGEIYNHIELREYLQKKGHKFNTDHSDTEVLLNGYREWGKKLPDKLNGMWAFGIYDKKNNDIFLSRDRFGKKPLYYTKQKGTFAFSSELSSVIEHSSISAKISMRSLKKYYAYGYIPAPNTLYNQIYKLPAGHNLLVDCRNFSYKKEKYWEFVIEPFESIPKNPEDVWGEQLRELLQKAVTRRMIADVPLGIFLSGGIDSSSIVAFAANQSSNPKDIKTLSIGFDELSFDESQHSEAVANYFNTSHRNRVFSISTVAELIPEVAGQLDEPFGDSSVLPMSLLCKEARKHVKVALGGDGADELFAGYDPFRALKLAQTYSSLIPKPIHKGIRLLMAKLPTSHRNMSLDFKINRTLLGLSYPKQFWNPIWMGPLEPKELREFFLEPILLEDVYSEALDCWDECRQENPVDKTLQFYTKLYLQDDILTKVDRASMMHSLEVRAPYLDIDVVNFVRQIPACFKYRNGKTKYILKKALDPILPGFVINRNKKGFGMPIGLWFKNGGINFDKSQVLDQLNQPFIQEMIQQHREGKKDNRLFLWNTYILNESTKYLGAV